MKFNLNHDPNNKTLAIPRAALQLSGLAGVSDLILHTDSGCILLLPGDPTVAELLKTISLISAVAPQLISRLAERSRMAMEAGMTETACGACERGSHCSGLEIPPCQLAEAGISPNAALESFVEEGRVIVQAAEKNTPSHKFDLNIRNAGIGAFYTPSKNKAQNGVDKRKRQNKHRKRNRYVCSRAEVSAVLQRYCPDGSAE